MPPMAAVMANRLDSIFSPQSIAVVGASRSEGKVGWEILHSLLAYRFKGRVYPVNPRASSVHSIRAYPSLLDIPDPVDLAVIVVPSAYVLQVVEEAGQKGVQGLIVITAGFSETGEKGRELEERLEALVRKHGMVMVGPNCMGVINTHASVQMDATFSPILPLRGNIAFMTQSGALGVAILQQARNRGVGLSKFVSLGNAADVALNEFIEYLEGDEQTNLILLYIESFGQPREFVPIARRVTKAKPILALKSGRTEAGRRAAASHTGALAGPDIGTQALFEQTGVLRAETIEELFDLGAAFALQPLPQGRRVAVVTNGGGPGIMAMDALVRVGMKPAQLSKKTTDYLRARIPEEASPVNPVDLIADADAERYAMAVEAVLKDTNVDALLAISVPPVVEDEVAVARSIWRTARKQAKPVVSTFLGRGEQSPGVTELVENGIPTYLFPEGAARALAAMRRYQEYLEREEGEYRQFRVRRKRSREIVGDAVQEGRTHLHEMEALELLRCYGFRIVKSRLVGGLSEAADAANEIGYPVALKALHPEILHKTDYGAVVLDIRTEEELRKHHRTLARRLATQGFEIHEWIVQEYARGGKETIMGMNLDEKFGPMLVFGLGGIYVEVLNDVVFRLTPMTDADALRMVQGIRSYPILEGVRGEPPSDVAKLAESLQRLSQLVQDFPEIEAVDINPYLVFEMGKGCKVVDARVLLTAFAAEGTS
ncbi:MAG: acetate--CoA ligase family protein [Thermoplasmata archaeon]